VARHSTKSSNGQASLHEKTGGNPRLSTLVAVTKAFGLKLTVEAAQYLVRQSDVSVNAGIAPSTTELPHRIYERSNNPRPVARIMASEGSVISATLPGRWI